MNFKSKITSILAIALTLGFLNCGSSGTNTGQIGFGNSSGTSAFTVSSSSPAHNQYYVAKSTHTITIRMTEAVAQTSAAANVQLVKKVGGSESNVTSAYNITVNNEIITLQGSSDLSDNADYEIRLYPGLAATSGDTLLQGQSFQFFYVDFSTGNGGTQGQSLAGPPSVSNITRSNYNSCFGALVQFNESLAYQPQVTIEYKDFIFQWHTIPVYAYPAMSNNNTQWHVDLDAGYCSDIITGSNVKVHVIDYVDLEGNHGTQSDHSFTFWG